MTEASYAVSWPIVALLCIVTLVYILRERRYREMITNLYQQAITDGLTGLHNHIHLMTRLQEEVDRSNRYKRPLSLLMIDLDHFKQYNDTYGHQAGDELLRQVAHVLKTNLRRADVTSRYGGEEFVILLPETNADGGKVAAERLRSRIADMPGVRGKVTVSIGVATTLGGDTSLAPSYVLRVADEAMYEAKSSGRNTVRFRQVQTTQEHAQH